MQVSEPPAQPSVRVIQEDEEGEGTDESRVIVLQAVGGDVDVKSILSKATPV